MKKTLILFLAAVACAITVPAVAARHKTVKGSGKIVTETRSVGAFHAVEAGSVARVFVGDYPADRVTVKVDDNLLAYVKVDVDKGELRIGFTDISVQDADLTVYVPASGVTQFRATGLASLSLETPLEGITLVKTGGASNFTAMNSLKTHDATLESSGTARITIESLAGTVSRIMAAGASAIDLKGEPTGHDTTVESSGTARIGVESLAGTVSRIVATGASAIDLKGQLTGRDVAIQTSGTSRIAAESTLDCGNAAVESSGSSRIAIGIKCTDCRIKTSGTANTTATLDVTTLDVESSGNTGMTLSGTASSCRINAGGTSRIDTTRLKSDLWNTSVGKYAIFRQ